MASVTLLITSVRIPCVHTPYMYRPSGYRMLPSPCLNRRESTWGRWRSCPSIRSGCSRCTCLSLASCLAGIRRCTARSFLGLIAICPSPLWTLRWSCPSKRSNCTTNTCLLLETYHYCRSRRIGLHSWRVLCRIRFLRHCWTFHSIFQFMIRSVLCRVYGRISTRLNRRCYLWGRSTFRFLTFSRSAIGLSKGQIHWQMNQSQSACFLWSGLSNKIYPLKTIFHIHFFHSFQRATLQYTVFLNNTRQALCLGNV